MDKQILVQYIDACAQVEDTKREILKQESQEED